MPRKTSPRTKESNVQVNISSGTILKLCLIVLAFFALYFLHDILAILLLALLLAALIEPFAEKLSQKKVPRGIAVAIIYVILILLMVGLGLLVVPTTIEQLSELLTEYAPLIEQASGGQIVVSEFLSGNLLDQEFNVIFETIQKAGFVDAIPELFSVIASTFGGVLTFILIFILAFYMVIEEGALAKGISLTPKKYQKFIKDVTPELRHKVGAWLRGQLLLMFIIFLMTYVALLILGVPFALVLALIAGLLEIVPFIGPILSAVPAIIIAFSLSPVHAILVAVVYFLIQQFEGEILTPKIMQKAVGLNPVISILVILIGFKIGILWAVLAIPTTMVIGVFLHEWFKVKDQLS